MVRKLSRISLNLCALNAAKERSLGAVPVVSWGLSINAINAVSSDRNVHHLTFSLTQLRYFSLPHSIGMDRMQGRS